MAEAQNVKRIPAWTKESEDLKPTSPLSNASFVVV
jgi:hypothetical protein